MQAQIPQAPQAPVGAWPGANATEAYTAVRNYRRELGRQLENLENKRAEVVRSLDQSPSGAPRTALESRLAELDRQIADVDRQIATANSQVAAAAGAPGAVYVEPRTDTGPPEELIVIPVLFILCVFLPLSIAYARRIWRRSSAAVSAFPSELAERMSRLEQGMESTAVEVERIGEGQRFLTKLFTEGAGARLVSQVGPEPLKIPARGEER